MVPYSHLSSFIEYLTRLYIYRDERGRERDWGGEGEERERLGEREKERKKAFGNLTLFT